MADDLVTRTKVARYLLLNEEAKSIKAQQAELKAELEPLLLAADTNARGSHVLGFSQPVSVAGVNYTNLQRVRKESKVLNEERALEFLLKDQAFETAVEQSYHVNQDALWELFVEDFIDQATLDSFFDITVSWAFQPTKE